MIGVVVVVEVCDDCYCDVVGGCVGFVVCEVYDDVVGVEEVFEIEDYVDYDVVCDEWDCDVGELLCFVCVVDVCGFVDFFGD